MFTNSSTDCEELNVLDTEHDVGKRFTENMHWQIIFILRAINFMNLYSSTATFSSKWVSHSAQNRENWIWFDAFFVRLRKKYFREITEWHSSINQDILKNFKKNPFFQLAHPLPHSRLCDAWKLPDRSCEVTVSSIFCAKSCSSRSVWTDFMRGNRSSNNWCAKSLLDCVSLQNRSHVYQECLVMSVSGWRQSDCLYRLKTHGPIFS